jgi:AcrR family transcriptional regulator
MAAKRQPTSKRSVAPREAGDPDVGNPPQARDGRAATRPRTWNATAQRILSAARDLLERSPVAALSMDAVAREAGVDKRLIFYYFKTRAGLLDALIDWYLGGEVEEMRRFYATTLERGEDRQLAVAEGHRSMIEGPDARLAYLIYLDVAVHLLRQPDGRARLAGDLATYRQLNGLGISGETTESEDVRALSALTLALSDGLAMQVLAEPGAVDTERVWSLWRELAELVVRRAGR